MWFDRKDSDDARYDGMHALLLLTGAVVGLCALTFWSTMLVGKMAIPDILYSVVPWQGANVKPEPWEGLLYNTGLLLIPFCAFLVWALFHRFLLRYPAKTARTFALIPACIISIFWLIQIHGVGGHFTDLIGRNGEPTWQVLLPLHIGMFIAIIICAALLFLKKRIPLPHIEPPLLVEALCVGLFAAFLSFDPHSLVSLQQTTAAETDWFLAPLHDILHGKQLLVDSVSQYGLLLFYILTPLCLALGNNAVTLGIAMMIAHFFYFSLLYILIRLLCKTRVGAVIAYAFAIGWTIMHNELRFETYAEPSVTKLRNFLDVPVLLTLLLEYKTKQKRWFIASCSLAAIALLYNADIGINLSLTVAFWSIVLPLFDHGSFNTTGLRILKRLLLYILCLCAAVALATLFLWGLSGSLPDWSLYARDVSLYVAGFGAMPMPIVGAQWLILSAYIAAVLAATFAWITRRPLPFAPFLLTVAAYGYLAFHYYLNRSFISNLWVVSLPAMLCFIMLGNSYWQRVRSDEFKDSLISPILRFPLLLLGSVILGVGLWSSVEGTQSLIMHRYLTAAPVVSVDETFQTQLADTKKTVDALLKPQERVGVIASREFVFLQALDRASAFKAPLLQTIFTFQEMQNVLNAFVSDNHQYLFVEHAYDRCPLCDMTLESLKASYVLKETGALLDIYTRKGS